MTRQEKRNQKDLQHQERNKRLKAQKKTSEASTANRPKRARERIDLRTPDWDELDLQRTRTGAKPSLPKVLLHPDTIEGQVISIASSGSKVRCGNQQLNCAAFPGVVAGDRVLVSRLGEHARIDTVLPRTSALSRPDPHNPRLERVIAANVDLVVVVVSIKNPALSLGLIDRYLIAIEKGGAQPVICVNKFDLIDSGEELAPLQPYRQIGIRVIPCSAVTGSGLDTLTDALAGKLCVFTGHSGVGKSSLLNAVLPGLHLATKAVTEAREKGRHTTTASTLYELPNGASIIDTPGIREFGLWDFNGSELRNFFHDFDPYAPDCAFSNCTHTHEPDCAVTQAVKQGSISSARYDGYLRILNSLSEQ